MVPERAGSTRYAAHPRCSQIDAILTLDAGIRAKQRSGAAGQVEVGWEVGGLAQRGFHNILEAGKFQLHTSK